jgi:hypothetical protein
VNLETKAKDMQYISSNRNYHNGNLSTTMIVQKFIVDGSKSYTAAMNGGSKKDVIVNLIRDLQNPAYKPFLDTVDRMTYEKRKAVSPKSYNGNGNIEPVFSFQTALEMLEDLKKSHQAA